MPSNGLDQEFTQGEGAVTLEQPSQFPVEEGVAPVDAKESFLTEITDIFSGKSSEVLDMAKGYVDEVFSTDTNLSSEVAGMVGEEPTVEQFEALAIAEREPNTDFSGIKDPQTLRDFLAERKDIPEVKEKENIPEVVKLGEPEGHSTKAKYLYEKNKGMMPPEFEKKMQALLKDSKSPKEAMETLQKYVGAKVDGELGEDTVDFMKAEVKSGKFLAEREKDFHSSMPKRKEGESSVEYSKRIQKELGLTNGLDGILGGGAANAIDVYKLNYGKTDDQIAKYFKPEQYKTDGKDVTTAEMMSSKIEGFSKEDVEKLLKIESSGKYGVMNKGSGAFGAYQFTSSTSKGLIAKLDGVTKSNWMEPKNQDRMFIKFTNDNIKRLKKFKNIKTVAFKHVYAAHQLGLGGAKRFFDKSGEISEESLIKGLRNNLSPKYKNKSYEEVRTAWNYKFMMTDSEKKLFDMRESSAKRGKAVWKESLENDPL